MLSTARLWCAVAAMTVAAAACTLGGASARSPMTRTCTCKLQVASYTYTTRHGEAMPRAIFGG